MAGDWANYQTFLDASTNIRRASVTEKEAFFHRYNNEVAPRLATLEANFELWAYCLAPAHPPPNTVVNLHVDAARQGDYATQYRFEATQIRVPAAGCVWHCLVPVENPGGHPGAVIRNRVILLFRGTAQTPATWRSHRGSLHTEPIGAYADGNVFGVSKYSFYLIRSSIDAWLAIQSQQRRHVTFVGYSLGGSLAMRSLLHHATRNPPTFEWQQSELYMYAAPGLERSASQALTTLFDGDPLYRQLHAFWHDRDWVPVTGNYPRTWGFEYSSIDRPPTPADPTQALAVRRELHSLSVQQRHSLPFVALEEGWNVILAYRHESIGGEPVSGGLKHAFTDFTRQIPYGGVGATFVWVGMGTWTVAKVVLSQLRLRPNDWCQHTHH
jgi:pimeloyl-ACP methyl ester carboxylesterase